jgi:hypothetical protein
VKDTITKEEVEKCKERDLLENMLAEMAGEFPALSRVSSGKFHIDFLLWLGYMDFWSQPATRAAK